MKPLEKIIWQSDGMIAAHIFEGPVLSPDGSKLYFSDVRDERICEINTSILKNIPSGFQPKCILQDEGQINGLVFNGDDQLLGCRMFKPTGIVWIDTTGVSKPKPVVESFGKKPLNGPNDLVWDERSQKLFFTDPKMPVNLFNTKERLFSFDPRTQDLISCDELKRPNGIALWQDQTNKTNWLFVAESDTDKILRYEIEANGTLKRPVDFSVNLDSPVDGIALRPSGELFVASGKRIRRFSLDGRELPFKSDFFWSRYRVQPSNLLFLNVDEMIVTAYNLYRGTSKLFLVEI